MADRDEPLVAFPPAPLFEESAEDLYDNAPCGYLSTLPGGMIVKVNQTFLSWTGHRREDLVGRRRFQDLLSPGGRIFHETHYAPLLQMQGEVREIAVEIVCADGRRLPVLINSVLKRDADGKPLLSRTTIFNATDRKEYERELLRERQKAERADKAKGEFISMISHEIRTPLNAIMGVAHLLGMTELSPQQQKFVRILNSSSESLLNLINEVLDFSKIEAGKVSLEERACDLRRLVHGIVESLHPKADAKGVALEVEIDERVPESLLGDPVKITQVLTNLLSNAIKFTGKGSVTVILQVRELEPDAVSIDFRVVDTGIGIAPDRLSQIFDDFTQASYDIGLKYGGTGLGLAISRRLVELYGSQIAVESELGRGTTFSFVLRLKRAMVAAASGEETGEPAGQRLPRGLRVLVADDNEVNVLVLTGFLREWSIEYEVVTNGRLAVEWIQERDYDAVLMDLRMPDLDGYAATRQIRSLPDPKFSRLPIFAISASTRMGQQHELEAAGFTEFVGKPIHPDVLLAKMLLHLSRTP
ncbi:MAG TPA: ATP-binding protein [Thermoanaerobaculia bacterium]|nr:ATP-binding protein [Thermoanaerobaculia bacterium]